MKRSTIAMLALLLIACATPTLNSTSVALPAYDSERNIGWAASRDDYAAALADTRYEMQQFTYESDGLTVGAYLYRAREPAPKAAPVIIFNRGSYLRPNGFAGEMLVMAHRFAEAGFIVVAPHYRGSNGWPGHDELGGAELHDLMNLPREIARIPGADASRLYLAGESRGGAMVYMALRDGFPARAAAVWGAFTDLEQLAMGGPQAGFVNTIWPQYENNREELYRTRSALRWVDKIHAPVLIMHGSSDEDIPLTQSVRMAAEMKRLQKVCDFIVFAGEHHVIGGRGAERDAATVDWFNKY